MSVLTNISLIVILLSVIVIIRNNQVYKYRMKILDLVFAQAMRDVREGRDPIWRYDAMRDVSYESMLYQFWKPLDSFWDEAQITGPL